MELLIYLSRSFLILLLFITVYHLFLKNDAHYSANRFYLLFGLMAATLLPLAELKYDVVVEGMKVNNDFIPIETVVGEVVDAPIDVAYSINWMWVIMGLYLAITTAFVIRLFVLVLKMYQLLACSEKIKVDGVIVCVNAKVETPFVFGNRIFINSKSYLQADNQEILSHEKVHLNQQHWIDVFLSELFIVLQWFNPFAWHYARLVKQNLEFIADRGVLDKGFKYEKYIQHIICETMGAEASVLANHFRFSQNKRRLKMMKNDKKSKWRLLKLLLVLPLVGSLLWAFSEPVYKYRTNSEVSDDTVFQEKKRDIYLRGYVFSQIDTQMVRNNESGLYEEKVLGFPLPGTSVVIKGTTIGTVVDLSGEFQLEVAKGDELVFSFVGFETQTLTIKDQKSVEVVLSKSSYELDPSAYRAKYKGKMVPPPPPPLPATKKDKEMIPPPPPPPPTEDGKPVFYVVENMPSYKGGMDGYFANLYTWITNTKEKTELNGVVNVQFTVNAKGGISNIKALNRWDEKEAKYAVKIVSELKDWKPGEQRGKPVSTTLVVPVEFD